MILPIDSHLPAIVTALEERGALVLVAEPGAGKTTRVPPALLAAGGEVLVLEPRRVAARLAARRVAEEIGEPLGGTVGYHVRFESCASESTRLRYITEGILERRLQRDPRLEGVRVVVLDELHERSLHTDLALALTAQLRRTERPDLRIVAMSATLDPAPVAAFLGAEVVSVPGRLFPVQLEYLPDSGRRDVPLPRRVAGALSRLLDAWGEGDVLVFLPGIGDIRRCQEQLTDLARRHDLVIAPLHGSMPLEEQARALAAAPGHRKVILSTNLAESSLTVEGVTAVIDSGLARVAGTLPGSGLPALSTSPISRASADQRAGRAGRLRPGLCVRLYTEADYHGRVAHGSPEILTSELVDASLAAAAAGRRLADLQWLDPPPPAALAAADRLLSSLGAADERGAITATGRAMARLPLPARLARFLVEADRRGCGGLACQIAATVSDGDRSGDDVTDLVEAAVAGAPRGRSRDRVERSRRQLAGILRPRADEKLAPAELLRQLRQAMLAGHPDRVGERRPDGQLVLAGGGSARLAGGGHGLDDRHFVVLDAHGGGGARDAVVTAVTAIETDWLIDLHHEWVEERQLLAWNADAERVESREQLTYGSLVLEESTDIRPRGEAVSALLFEQALAAGLGAFCDPAEVEGLLARLAFARTVDDSLPALAEDATHAALRVLCAGRSSLAELRRARLLEELRANLETTCPGALARIDRLAPEHVTLAGGRRLRVEYDPAHPPCAKSMLQDFFGQTEGPRVGGGRVPVVLHLLAPNRRPVQITTDLAGFWERHYEGIRRQLRQRYTRHDWPEDPLTARPPAPRRRRR